MVQPDFGALFYILPPGNNIICLHGYNAYWDESRDFNNDKKDDVIGRMEQQKTLGTKAWLS